MFRRPSKTINLRSQLGMALKADRLDEALDLYEMIEKRDKDEPRWAHRRGDLLQRMWSSPQMNHPSRTRMGHQPARKA